MDETSVRVFWTLCESIVKDGRDRQRAFASMTTARSVVSTTRI